MMKEPSDTPRATPPPLGSSLSGADPVKTQMQRGIIAPPDIPGTLGKLDRFMILKLLGQGGMGQVYLAHDPDSSQDVAIKVMRPELANDPHMVGRFLNEAQHMHRFSHPNILNVLEISGNRQKPYYTMPYVTGGSLQNQCVAGQLLSSDRVLEITQQIAGALNYAHSRGIIHRDIKPANVLLDNKGTAYLTDFGLVRTVFNDAHLGDVMGKIEGTASYLSPATANGKAEDTRCDIYAFGVLLYEMLTGRVPYSGSTAEDILAQVKAGPPPAIRAVNPKADPKLTAVAEGCMARELRDRYAAMDDVATDLSRIARGKSPFGVHRKKSSFSVWAGAVLIGIFIIGGVVGTVMFQQKNRMPHSKHQVMQEYAAVTNAMGDSLAFLSFDPSLPAFLNAEEKLKITLEYEVNSAEQVWIVMTPYTSKTPAQGCKTYVAPMISKEKGTFEGWISFGKAKLIDEIYVQMQTGDKTILVSTSQPIRAQWNDATVPSDASRQESFVVVEPFTYMIANGVATITKYDGQEKVVEIPEEIDGVPVTTIGSRVFQYDRDLSAIHLPASLVNIGESAFENCTELTAVVFPSDMALTHIGRLAFHHCFGLTELPIPASVMTIGDRAFACCYEVLHCRIPARVTTLGYSVFSNCKNLFAFEVDPANVAYCSEDGVLFDKRKKILLSFPAGRGGDYTIPDGVERITFAAFSNCPRLTKVTIPASMKIVDPVAFYNCTALSGICFQGDAPLIATNSIDSCNNATIRYLANRSGWSNEVGGRPALAQTPATNDTIKSKLMYEHILTPAMNNSPSNSPAKSVEEEVSVIPVQDVAVDDQAAPDSVQQENNDTAVAAVHVVPVAGDTVQIFENNARIRGWLDVVAVDYKSVNGLNRVRVTVKSRKQCRIRLVYSISWFDRDGMEIDKDTKTQRNLIIGGMDTVSFMGVAPGVTAVTCKLRALKLEEMD